MVGAFIEVPASILVTAAIFALPGAALISVLRAWSALPVLARPAATVLASVLVSAPLLVATLTLGRSIITFGVALGALTVALFVVALLQWRPDGGSVLAGQGLGQRLRNVVSFAVPTVLLAGLALVDAPHVRSDTFWHVGLARRLADVEALSSAAIAFEAGAPGNANYPLPVWHALVALADQVPRVDAWSATWFMTVWLAPVAMLAFGAMAAALVGERRAGLVGCWTFLGVVVLGYGPYFLASRYLSYAGQAAIYLALPIVLVALVRSLTVRRAERVEQLAIAVGGTVAIGLLHGNYVLYPALFALGGTVALVLGGRREWRGALLGSVTVLAAGAGTLAAQLPWITDDDNFLRGASDPAGEPSAFIRHRDVLVGSEASFHVELGSLATQPWLVLGALAIPATLLASRRRPGPWVLAGGATAIVVCAWLPWVVGVLDRLGSVTPVTRLDRIYPAAVGVVAILLGIGRMLDRSFAVGRSVGMAAVAGTLAVVGALTWWMDAVRDTKRIVVTPFVEARWVGGLDPDGLPRIAVVAAAVAVVAVAAWVRLRDPLATIRVPASRDRSRRRRHLLAALAAGAVVAGLTPATVDRLRATWEPQAYASARRDDRSFARVEVYPATARAAVVELPPGTVVLAGFNDARRIAALAPVQSVEESVLRDLVAEPPRAGAEARGVLDELVQEWQPDYVVASRFDRSFAPLLDAAQQQPERFRPIDAGPLRMFRVDHVD